MGSQPKIVAIWEAEVTERQKIDGLIQELRLRGVSQYTTAPPLFRALWALGIRVRPPLFAGFLTITVLMGLSFAVLWGVAMWLLQWQGAGVPVEVVAVTAIRAGMFFGLVMGGYYRWKAARLGLPSWETYSPLAGGQVMPSATNATRSPRRWLLGTYLVSVAATIVKYIVESGRIFENVWQVLAVLLFPIIHGVLPIALALLLLTFMRFSVSRAWAGLRVLWIIYVVLFIARILSSEPL